MKLDLVNASNSQPVTVDTSQLAAVEGTAGGGAKLHFTGGQTIDVAQSHESVTEAWAEEGGGEIGSIASPAQAAANPPPPPPPPPVARRATRGGKAR